MSHPAIEALIAGLGHGAVAAGKIGLGRKAERADEARKKREDTAASERALAVLAQKPVKDDVQIVTGEDENGPGIFAVDKQKGTKRRITDEAMTALTGAPSPRPSPVPAGPTETETHGVDVPPAVSQDTTPPKRALGLRPKPVPGERPQLVLGADGRYVPADPRTGLGPDGQPVAAYKPPVKPELTEVDENGHRVLRAKREGLEVPSPTGMGANAMRTKIAENRARLRDVDNALAEYNKHPESTGGLLRDISDVVPVTATAITKWDQNKHPELVPAQAAIANIGSMIIHDRSGAAVTISEFPRLVPFIPQKGDSPAVVRSKLTQLKSQIERMNEEMEQMAGQSRGRGNQPSPAASAKPSYEEWKAQQGRKPPE